LAAPSSLQDLDERECAGRCVLGLTSCQALERGRRRVGGSAMVDVVVSGVLQSTDEGSCVKEEQERLLLDATNARTEVDVVKVNGERLEGVGAVRIFVNQDQGHWSQRSGASQKRASGPGSLVLQPCRNDREAGESGELGKIL
jgi:hypothetical protein